MKKILILFLLFSFIGFNSQAETLVKDDGNQITKVVKMQKQNVDVFIINVDVPDGVDIGLESPTYNNIYKVDQVSTNVAKTSNPADTFSEIPINWETDKRIQHYLYKDTTKNKQIYSRADFTDTNKIPIACVSNYTLELRTC